MTIDLKGRTLSNLIHNQFPKTYLDRGPLFVAFVEEYFKWMEQKSSARDSFSAFTLNVTNRSANVTGNQTLFQTEFANGDSIAIVSNNSTSDYKIYTIDTISNNTFLTLTSNNLPDFSLDKTKYATVSSKPNSYYITRYFDEIMDIDTTFDDYVVYFKDKYLHNIQLETITNTRTLIKHSLDLYRSKGSERSLDLLYKIVFGLPASVYYPKTDIFSLSSGDWFVPRYLELSITPVNKELINKEILGTISGATAFVEEIIRKSLSGLVSEVAYISAIDGNFITGERVILKNYDTITIDEAPVIVGSLNSLQVSTTGTGTGFSENQDVVLTSTNGVGGKGRRIICY